MTMAVRRSHSSSATATSWLFMTAMRDVKAKAMRHGAEEKEKIM